MIRASHRVRESIPCPECVQRWWSDAGEDADEAMRLPLSFRNADPDHLYPHQQAVLVALGKAEWDRPMAVLVGKPGTGKTWAVAACMRAVRQLGRSVVYWGVGELMDRYRETYAHQDDDTWETVGEINASLAKVHLLVLDDWGHHRDTSMAATQLFRLVASRIDNRQPTIITTNDEEADFKSADPALHSRLFGRDSDVSVFRGRDLRQE